MKAIPLPAMLALALWSPAGSPASPPSITIVTAPQATALEAFAAQELSSLLHHLFAAQFTLNTDYPGKAAENLILLGNPATNPAVASAAGTSWPVNPGPQDHLLLSTPSGLVIAGASPVATLWAVYEFGYANGMRYLPSGDFAPVQKGEFTLAGYNTLLRPVQNIRAWRTLGDRPASQVSWGIAAQETLLGQLAKLKFNRVILVMQPWQAFVQGDSGDLWIAPELPVDGDTAGRSAFGGAKVFANPDLAAAGTAPEKHAAAVTLAQSIIASAQRLGMTATIEIGGSVSSALSLYSQADQITQEEATLPTLFVSHPQGAFLPHHPPVTPTRDGAGFAVDAPLPGEHGPAVHYLARASFDASLNPDHALTDLVTPICGEGVVDSLRAGLAALSEASALIDREDPGFAIVHPRMILQHLEAPGPIPPWWAEAKQLYGRAIAEFYRANTRSRDGARSLILYHAKQSTFALHYMQALESTRNAGLARAAADEVAWVENLELAVEAMHNALGIFSEVAADPSDRGLIAILNAFAYHPLLRALHEPFAP